MSDQNQATTVVRVGKYNIRVDKGLCISASSCVVVSPNVFELDAEGKAVVKGGADDTPENIILAAQSCPVRAIVITDAQTGEQLWPK